MDQEFDLLIPDFPVLNINPTATIKHVLEIERKIRFIKERARSIHIKTPFKRTPKIIIIELIKFIAMWINTFPVKSGVSTTVSPCTTMNHTVLDWHKQRKAEFGAYCEVHKENRQLNNINNEQTQSDTCLVPTTKFQGSYTLLCLTTGMCIIRK